MSAPRILAGAAAVLAVLALLAGSPAPRTGAPIEALAAEIEAERDHIDALTLARWIRDGRPGLAVLDVRGEDLAGDYAIPGARTTTLPRLLQRTLVPDETLVLYSEGGAHAAQAWVLLRARGARNVYFLRGGLYEWITQVIEARLPADASDEQRAAFAEVAALSRWFGGTPIAEPGSGRAPDAVDIPEHLIVHTHEEPGDPREAVARVRRRGC